jgi:ADP-ribosylglycohydrolase
MLASLSQVLGDLNDPPIRERQSDRPTPIRLRDRIAEIGNMLEASPREAFDRLQNGAFVLESLPSALWSFLRTPEEPGRVVLTAVSGGYDADTVASMAGSLAGAYHGDTVFEGDWLSNLEYADRLRDLAAGLFDQSGCVEGGNHSEAADDPPRTKGNGDG